jgi:hypothetical protein
MRKSMNMQSYGKHSWVVRGKGKNSENLEDNVILKKLGGVYNKHLQGGEGWLFAKGIHDKALEMYFKDESFFDETGQSKVYVCDNENESEDGLQSPEELQSSDEGASEDEFETTATRLRSYYYTSRYTLYSIFITAFVILGFVYYNF